MKDPHIDQEEADLLTLTLPDTALSERLDKALARIVPEEAALSRSRLVQMIHAGEVLVNGTAWTDPSQKITPPAEICLYLSPPEILETLPQDIPLDIVFEDKHLIIINKPAGMVVHPAPGTPNGTVVNALLFHCADTLSGIGGARRPGIVHRIDKDTSGLIVVSKSDAAHQGLAAQFEQHSVTRRYLALVHGHPSGADPRLRGLKGVSFESNGIVKIATLLARHKHDRQRQAIVWHDGRYAVTRARPIEHFSDQATLVECWLETGRTHQIRVHMSYAGHGLLGDQTYGGRQKVSPKVLGLGAAEAANTFPRQALHAASLGFEHPITKEPMMFTAPLPADFDALLTALRQGVMDAAK